MSRSPKTIGQVTADRPVPSLAVINAAGATLEGNKLTLTGVAASSIVFADRPVRAAGHVATEQFIMQWDKRQLCHTIRPMPRSPYLAETVRRLAMPSSRCNRPSSMVAI